MQGPNEEITYDQIFNSYQIKKGSEFNKAFSSYYSEKENSDYWKFFNEKKYRISEKLISFRLKNHWEK